MCGVAARWGAERSAASAEAQAASAGVVTVVVRAAVPVASTVAAAELTPSAASAVVVTAVARAAVPVPSAVAAAELTPSAASARVVTAVVRAAVPVASAVAAAELTPSVAAARAPARAAGRRPAAAAASPPAWHAPPAPPLQPAWLVPLALLAAAADYKSGLAGGTASKRRPRLVRCLRQRRRPLLTRRALSGSSRAGLPRRPADPALIVGRAEETWLAAAASPRWAGPVLDRGANKGLATDTEVAMSIAIPPHRYLRTLIHASWQNKRDESHLDERAQGAGGRGVHKRHCIARCIIQRALYYSLARGRSLC